jgi:hypothetical protein
MHSDILLKRTGVVPSEELLSSAMNVYANAGNVVRTEAFMARFLTGWLYVPF